MPIPSRKQGEAEDTFISRCIGDLSGEYETSQASAICYQQLAINLTADKSWRQSFLDKSHTISATLTHKSADNK